jgi:hypothetical protein
VTAEGNFVQNVSKQVGVSKVPETRRCIIGHGIGRAGNMVIARKAVAMMALVKTAHQAEEVGGRITGGDGAFGGSAGGRGVVVEEREGAFTGINRLGEDVLVLLGDDASKFKVAIG